MSDLKHIVIIGNGIAGISAARHIRKLSNYRITVVSGESDYFFSRTALMYVYMGHMKFDHTQPYENWFWEKNKIDLVNGWVTAIDYENQLLTIQDQDSISYDELILATGSVSNKFGWPGQDAQGVSGLYSKQDLEYIQESTNNIKKAVVVGGGLIGVELAEMLHSRQIEVTFLVREDSFWNIVLPPEESNMINEEIQDYGIDLKLSTELKEIITNEKNEVIGVETNHGERIDCEFVGLTVGVSPNIHWLKNGALNTNRGIMVNEYLETNMPNVYAIGDCAEHENPVEGRRPVEQVWYTGRMMGETVARTITGNRTAYQPGIWFNSAKFFNLEYQTYGMVSPTLSIGEDQFLWQSIDKKKCLRIIFEEKSTAVVGVNALGIRMRHDIWDRWILEKRKLNEVMEELEKANFDPELFKSYEYDIRCAFNDEFEFMTVKNKKPSILKRLFA